MITPSPLSFSYPIFSAAFSPTHDRIAVGGIDGSIRCYQTEQKTASRVFLANPWKESHAHMGRAACRNLLYTSDGSTLFAGFSLDSGKPNSNSNAVRIQDIKEEDMDDFEGFESDSDEDTASAGPNSNSNSNYTPIPLSVDGQSGLVCACDVETGKVTWESALSSPVNAMIENDSKYLFTGDDKGVVCVWDIRQSPLKSQPVHEWSDHSDFCGALYYHYQTKKLVSVGGDGMLMGYDLRKGTLQGKSQTSLSEELLCIDCIKNNTRKPLIVCGSSEGALYFWEFGYWGEILERFPGHPGSIEALQKIDEDAVMTACSDGYVRVIGVQPHKFMGIVDSVGENAIERMCLSRGNSVLGLVYGENLKFVDVDWVYNESDDSEEHVEEMEEMEEEKPTGFFADL